MNNAQRDALAMHQHERIEAIQKSPLVRTITVDEQTGHVTFVRRYADGRINRVIIDECGTTLLRSQFTRTGHVTPLELAGTYLTVMREHVDEVTFHMGLANDTFDDHVDTNVIMDEAFLRVMGRRAWLPSDWDDGATNCTEAEEEADLDLTNAAVQLVRMHPDTD